jgi:aspartokinase-like uncharacterized kinase
MPMTLDTPPSLHVIKVGGSLLDLPDLGERLRQWLGRLPTQAVVLVPGGGRLADVIRLLDNQHDLGPETAHWLALRAAAVNAPFLAALLKPQAVVVTHVDACPVLWHQGMIPILDVYCFMQADEGHPDCLPHTWAVTTDSVAARFACVAGARQLILLKSVTLPEAVSWSEAARQGFVDDYFAEVVSQATADDPVQFVVRTINFRAWQP